jgi:uncharacterized protein (TIGR03118 family)
MNLSQRMAALLAATALTSATAMAADGPTFVRTNLVSNLAGVAKTTDPNMQNPWGIAFAPGGAFWFSDNTSGLSTLYDGQGDIVPLVVTIPGPSGAVGTPTGMVWNPTLGGPSPAFTVTSGSKTAGAEFIFDSEDGTISGWSASVDFPSSVIAVDNSTSGAVYKGLALATNASGMYLYATNFRAGTVEVYDTNFKPATLTGSFTDPDIKPGYAPFGIANIDGDLFVTYALQDGAKHDDVAGPHHGYVDVFSADGVLLRHFATHGLLNSPWGIARAPYGFGQLAGDILIGNFGDGHIIAYPPAGGTPIGPLLNKQQTPVAIEGLWGLVTGTAAGADPDMVYFTAGPQQEANGLYGSIAKISTK